MPPPIIKIFFGIISGSNAPVESMTLGSLGIKSNEAGSDPTAMTAYLNVICCFLSPEETCNS